MFWTARPTWTDATYNGTVTTVTPSWSPLSDYPTTIWYERSPFQEAIDDFARAHRRARAPLRFIREMIKAIRRTLPDDERVPERLRPSLSLGHAYRRAVRHKSPLQNFYRIAA